MTDPLDFYRDEERRKKIVDDAFGLTSFAKRMGAFDAAALGLASDNAFRRAALGLPDAGLVERAMLDTGTAGAIAKQAREAQRLMETDTVSQAINRAMAPTTASAIDDAMKRIQDETSALSIAAQAGIFGPRSAVAEYAMGDRVREQVEHLSGAQAGISGSIASLVGTAKLPRDQASNLAAAIDNMINGWSGTGLMDLNSTARANLGAFLGDRVGAASQLAEAINPSMKRFLATRFFDEDLVSRALDYLDEDGGFEEGGEADKDSSADPIPSAFSNAVNRLNENSKRRISEASWFEIIAALLLLNDILSALLSGSAADANRAEHEQSQAKLVEIEEAQRSIQTTLDGMVGGTVEVERITALPRAEVKTRANVREEAHGKATRVAVLSAGEMVAIEAKEGRWLLVVYRDELSQTLQHGWVWKDSVELL